MKPTAQNAPQALLGQMTPSAFLARYWQRRPCLIRQAIPNFSGLLSYPTLIDLCARDDSEARHIKQRPTWQVRSGPLNHTSWNRQPKTHWTVLLNGLNLHLPEADALLRRFAFVPYSRLDDIMVSYAVDGGGVGAHVDSYDVFLLQGPGQRRWRIAPPTQWRYVDGAPLRLLENFQPTEEFVLDPGDMLYLPPGWGHEGTAIGTCWTYSIGFRAPAGEELSAAFLDYLHARGLPRTLFRDPGRTATRHPGTLDPRMIRFTEQTLSQIRWKRADAARLLGMFLTEPKAQVVFTPRTIAPVSRFMQQLKRHGIVLDPRTQLLVHASTGFINGEAFAIPRGARQALQILADQRRVNAKTTGLAHLTSSLRDWMAAGFIHFGSPAKSQRSTSTGHQNEL